MYTNKSIEDTYIRLQREFELEKNNIHRICNNTKTNRDIDANLLLQDLTTQYNIILKRINRICEIYNATIIQLSYEYNENIVIKLNKTIAELPSIENFSLIKNTTQLIDRSIHNYLYSFNISEELSKYLISDIRPADTYVLTIEPDNMHDAVRIKINNQYTIYRYYYCNALSANIFILKRYKLLDEFEIFSPYTYMDANLAPTIFIRLFTQEYVIVNVHIDTKFMYYDNNIVAYTDTNLKYFTIFEYYIFDKYTLSYKKISRTFKLKMNMSFDRHIYSSTNDRTLFYIDNKNRLCRVKYNKKSNPQYKDILLDLNSYLDGPYIYKIMILKLENNILSLSYFKRDNSNCIYVNIHLSYSFIYEKSLYSLI